MHLNGVEQVLSLRGGIESLSSNRLVRLLLAWQVLSNCSLSPIRVPSNLLINLGRTYAAPVLKMYPHDSLSHPLFPSSILGYVLQPHFGQEI